MDALPAGAAAGGATAVLAAAKEPIVKLLDAVCNGIGTFYEPHHIRRIAKAKAAETIILAQADIEKQEVATRAARRMYQEAIREQENLDAVIGGAVPLLPETASDEPVDPDWMANFARMAKTVSTEELQSIWSHILAHEVGQPGAISRRTMAIVET